MHSSLTQHRHSEILSTINYLGTGSTIENHAVGRHLKSYDKKKEKKNMTPIGRDVYLFKSHFFNMFQRVQKSSYFSGEF